MTAIGQPVTIPFSHTIYICSRSPFHLSLLPATEIWIITVAGPWRIRAAGSHYLVIINTPSSSLTIVVLKLDSTFGCLFIAVIFTSALWGIGCIQLYLYYEKFWKSEWTWFKAYLFLIWVLDTVQQVLLSHSSYVIFVRGIGDNRLIDLISKTVLGNSIIIPIIDAMVQIIFVRHAWYVSNKNIILTGLLLLAVSGQFAVGLVYSIKISGLTGLSQLHSLTHVELALSCTVAFTDTVIAFTLTFLLWKSRSGMKRTDSIIKRIVTYTVGSSMVITLWALVALLGVIVAPNSFVYLLPDFIVLKLYVNCVLASLNSRPSLRGSLSTAAGQLSIRLENLPSTSAGSSNFASDASRIVPTHRHVECHSSIDVQDGSDRGQIWGDSSTSV